MPRPSIRGSATPVPAFVDRQLAERNLVIDAMKRDPPCNVQCPEMRPNAIRWQSVPL